MGATSGWSRGAVGRVHSCLAFRRRRWHRRRKVDYKPYTRESVGQFLTGPESLNRKELIWGIVREPPAPFCDHQSLVTRVLVLLAMHVSAARLGKVLVSPVDVVLDEQKALVLQPDVVFISNERRHIIKDRIWGAPDLTVEVPVARYAAAGLPGQTSLVSRIRRTRILDGRRVIGVDRSAVVQQAGTDPSAGLSPRATSCLAVAARIRLDGCFILRITRPRSAAREVRGIERLRARATRESSSPQIPAGRSSRRQRRSGW